jgi:hypothetical protein
MNGDGHVLKVEVPSAALRTGLDAQAQGFQEAQAAAVEDGGDEVGGAGEVVEDVLAFGMAEVGLLVPVRVDVGVLFGAESVQIA